MPTKHLKKLAGALITLSLATLSLTAQAEDGSFGAQQVVEVVFGDAAQEIAFEGILVEPQQGVERPDGLLVVVVHHA